MSSAFRIGLIALDAEDIDFSKVVFPAKSKNLDWELMNKLCEQNDDFEEFIGNVTKDYKVKTIYHSQYDEILEDPNKYADNLSKNAIDICTTFRQHGVNAAILRRLAFDTFASASLLQTSFTPISLYAIFPQNSLEIEHGKN